MLPSTQLQSVRGRRWVLSSAGFASMASGLLNLYSVIGPGIPERMRVLRQAFPIGFIGFSRSFVLLAGFALVVSSINLFRGKRRAFQIVFSLGCASVIAHLVKGIDYEEAICSIALLAILWPARCYFTVKSRIPGLRDTLLRLGVAFPVAFTYAAGGFWLLKKAEFGVNLTAGPAIRQALLALSLVAQPTVVPHTRYAQWFVHSLDLIAAVVLLYSLYLLFRPVVYKYSSHLSERAEARAILADHGRTSLDYFKVWPGKSYYFSNTRKSFLAYSVAANFAVVLGDPVGPWEEMQEIIRGFAQFCRENDWSVAFYQALPDLAPIYGDAEFKHFKVGDDAIVDLERFSLESSAMRATRSACRKLEKLGMRAAVVQPPVPNGVLEEIAAVSAEWLRIPGRRERTFTLGSFDRQYIRTTPVMTITDAEGRIVAFANIIPSFHSGEATIDLMRRRIDVPNGVMDYLLIQLFLHSKQQGFMRFSLGLAPMCGFQETEPASPEERALHAVVQRLNFVFSYRGIKAYKAKFASFWEPRYVYYSHFLELPKLAYALGRVSSIRELKHCRPA